MHQNAAVATLAGDTPKAATSFGWNIIGTMIGGAPEYSSLLIGYRMLTVVVFVLYALCFAWTFWMLRVRKEA